MACKIALHSQLERLRKSVGASAQCHSSRPQCQLGLSVDKDTTTVLGIQGAAVGYCQGLFNKAEGHTPAQHTEYFTGQLRLLDAPFSESHELLISQKREDMSVGDYVRNAAQPLLEEGRIPILITDYEVSRDYQKIKAIFDSDSPVKRGESMLVRITLGSDNSLDLAAHLINETVNAAKTNRKMPPWWPLLQGGESFDLEGLKTLHDRVGSNWDYVTLAVHPFSLGMLEDYKQNIAVAQWLVGRPNGTYANGDVNLHSTSCIVANGRGSYNIYEFGQQLKEAGLNPTSIVCGGSQDLWTEEDNAQRLRYYLPHFTDAVKDIWNLNEGRERHLLSLAS